MYKQFESIIKVKDLIAELQKHNPEAIVITSEKFGRGGPVGAIQTGFTNSRCMEYVYDKSNKEHNVPAIELSCDF